MNVRQWYDATSAKHGLGLSEAQQAARKAERARVLKRAGVDTSTLRIALCRQKKARAAGRHAKGVGDEILLRLIEATKAEPHKILWLDERPNH